MNGHHFQEYLTATAACDGDGKYAGIRELVREVSRVGSDVEWEVAVRGGDASRLRAAIRPRGNLELIRDVLSKLWKIPPESIPESPAKTRSWVEGLWDSKTGRWASVQVFGRQSGQDFAQIISPGGRRERLNTRRFAPEVFDKSIAPALEAFSTLAPIGSIQTRTGSNDWTLILEKPLPWSLFLRADIAAAFAPRAAQLSLLLRDARIVALDMSDGALWARLVG